jgi:hypothetical protein
MEGTGSSKTLATAYQNLLHHIPVGHNLITKFNGKRAVGRSFGSEDCAY